ncbi:MAG: RHS repeat-associated core domain-containing protein, partial [Verrucomicrobiota bacterium]|nr:RHS repeat-associated core domain-containing protein [Verrucomicrobiota bacterium]
IDGAGRKTRIGYDTMGRPQNTEWYEAGAVSPMAWNFIHYNPNGEVVWQDGPAFDPEDYVWMDYDGAGRLTTQIRWRARAKTDGSGIEAENGDNLYATTFNEYDPFGNLLKVRESLGHFSTFNYDALGRRIQQTFYASNGVFLKTEKVAYEPGDQITLTTNALGGVTETLYTSTGQPRFQRQPTGATNGWTYYLDGRPRKAILNNGSYWETTYDDVNRRVTNTFKNSANTMLGIKVVTKDRRGNEILSVDLGGNVFTNYFDGLDRLKGMAGPVFQTIDPTNAPPNPGGSNPAPLQQALTNYFDAGGVITTSINGVGDKTIVQVDALGRPLIRDIRNSSNQTVRLTTTTYFTNHHGMMVTEGSGASAITRFAFTDNDGQVVLSSGWSLTNRYEFTLRAFDVGGKLRSEIPASYHSGVTTYWPGSYFGYDGLGRVTSQTNRDNAVTTFTYDAMGNVLFRMNPGNLGWAATYNSAGQMLTSYDYSGVNQTRNHSHTYYSAGHAFAGLPQTFTDARNVVCTHVYNEWLRPLTNTYTGTLPEHYMREVFSYEQRGMLASLTEQFATNSTGAGTTIQRTYDPYGQLATESVLINTNVHSTVSIGRDSAGRRAGLGFSSGIPFGFNYGWRADGALTNVAGNFINGIYGYDTAGILTNRKVGTVTMNVTSRDGLARPLARATTRNGGAEGLMSETLTWTGDGLLDTHTTIREFTDERVYGYSATSRRLAEERLRLSTTTGWTNVFGFDEGTTAGIGALTRMAQPQTGGASWTASLDAFQRIDYETNNVIRRLAYGNVNSQDMFESLTVRLDGKPLPLTILQTSVTNVPLQWSSMMELAPGNHTLEATVLHRSGLFTNTTSHVFTNTALDITTVSDFNEGMLSQRQVRNVSNVVARTQNFSWDAKGRLWKITDRDANTNGFNWVAIYDGMGRRLENTSIIVTNNTVLTGQPKTIQSYYDPSVEFLELGVKVAGIPMAKFYGPDLDGNYGSLNGTGGFDGVTVLGPNFTDITVSDARGNLNGFYDDTHGDLYWTAARHTGYGAVPQYRPVPLGDEPELISASLWRGRWSDRSGFYYLGARYYDPVSGSFISPDPMGYAGGTWLYGFAEGDPVNGFDPDGRKASEFYQNGSATAQDLRMIGNALDQYSSSTDSVFLGSLAEFGSYFANMGASMGTPSSFVNQGISDYNAQGGGILGTLAIGNRYNPTIGLYGAFSGIEPIAGSELSSVDRWSSGLSSGGSTVLLGIGGVKLLNSLNPPRQGLRLNIFGEGEAPGFRDVSTSAQYASGTDGVPRPLTSSLQSGSASDIFIRSSPVTGEGTISEIMRLSQPGTRITYMLPQPTVGAQGQALINAFGRQSVDFVRTFTSQHQYPGNPITIIRITVGGK